MHRNDSECYIIVLASFTAQIETLNHKSFPELLIGYFSLLYDHSLENEHHDRIVRIDISPICPVQVE